MEQNTRQFPWTLFYSEFADKLLSFKDNRKPLLRALEAVFREVGIKYPFIDNGKNLDDICPFTVFGCFNRGITDSNRSSILTQIKREFDVKADIPTNFSGIPVLNNMSAWFFRYEIERDPNDIPNLWNMFEAGIRYAGMPSKPAKEHFIECFDIVSKQPFVKWNLTMGLYWIRPYAFINLDKTNQRKLVEEKQRFLPQINIEKELKHFPSGTQYLHIVESCKTVLANDNGFPAFSHAAWTERISETNDESSTERMSKANFIQWFTPLIQALKDLGGTGTPKQVRNRIIENEKLTEDIINKTRGELGLRKFDNEVAWARNYLAYEDIIDKAVRGVWSLTDHGKQVIMTPQLASDIFFKWVKILQERRKHNQTEDVGIIETNAASELAVSTEDVQILSEEPDMSGGDAPIFPYSLDAFLEEVFMDEEQHKTICSLLKRKKNIILQGAPGVGKTFLAKRLAYTLMAETDDDRIAFVQFHQSYSYEDFIIGYRPNQNGFSLVRGLFYNFCKKAEGTPDKDFFFIIDEINRGNLSKIFGELLMLIEGDKRGSKNGVQLAYTGQLFSVPENLYIIGLMNTADRSLAIIDYALRRRFSFVDIAPAFEKESFKTHLIKHGVDDVLASRIISKFSLLNKAIEADPALGRGFRIGHSYFCDCEDAGNPWYENIIKYEIAPMLEEYWFDNLEKVNGYVDELLG